jgi:hypothetical protein
VGNIGTTAAPLLLLFDTCLSITFEACNLMVAPGVVSPQDIGMSPMVCRLQELVGANGHHGLGVIRPTLLPYHALLLWSKKLGFTTTTTPCQKSYVGMHEISTVF